MKKNTLISIVLVLVVLVGGFFVLNRYIYNEKQAESDSLVGGVWTWAGTEMNDGTTVVPRQVDAFTLSFGADSISGTTDCNSFFGSYTEGEDRSLSFGPFGMTKMFCEGSQEAEFMRMVSDSNQYLITEDGRLVLLIKFDSGSVMFERLD